MEDNASIDNLPLELHSLIFSFVDRVPDLVVLKRVCKMYYKLAESVNLLEKMVGDKDIIKYFLYRKVPWSNVTTKEIEQRWAEEQAEHGNNDQYHYTFKTFLFGNYGVGKTTLTYTASRGVFHPAPTNNTIVCDFISSRRNEYGIPTKIQFWDPSGQERYGALARSVYRDLKSALLCFDLSDRSSFVALIQRWMRTFITNMELMTDSTVFYLVGLRSDLKDPKDNISADAEYLAKQFNMPYYEVSSSKFEGVEELMKQLNIDMLKAHCLKPMKIVRVRPSPSPPTDNWRCSIM